MTMGRYLSMKTTMKVTNDKMTNAHHSKKRNVGLMYEFLVHAISAAIIDNDDKRSATALRILKKHFKPGSEIYREFRLVNSLVKTRVNSEHTAASIIVEAKRAAREHDIVALDREKSALIRDINCVLNDENFYDRQINEYKDYATVQQLLNNWRASTKDVDIQALAKFEEQLFNRLCEKTEVKSEHAEDISGADNSPGMNRLVMKLMMKRLNEKYSTMLSPEQKTLIRTYAFSAVKDDRGVLKQKLCECRDAVTRQIDEYAAESKDDYVLQKLNVVKESLANEKFDNINDDTITKFLLYIKLQAELKSGDM